MNLKLLPKSEVDRLKNIDRQKEVEEGLKLSRRVDGLRRLVSQEEAVLEKFRSETVKGIMQEIADLNAQKEQLEAEIKALQNVQR